MIGSIVGNRYEIIERVGAGGMAIVYKARCRLLKRLVAVKILRTELKDDKEFIRRFDTEAQAAASLSHPNIVSVYDVGKHKDLHYIVMEYIEGETLKDEIDKKGALPLGAALGYSIQIASALQHAHSKNIIHRDIKPHNIIISDNNGAKVTDFGIARAVSSSTTVASGAAIGSVHYASPEQARGSFTDEGSDIYSLGIVMYEMFTGKLPFTGETPVSIAMQHIEAAPAPPTGVNADIPAAVEAIILKAIAKEPARRYQSAEQLIADLKSVRQNPEIEIAPPPPPDIDGTRKLPVISDDDIKNENIGGRKRRIKREDMVAIVAAIITCIAIVGFLGVMFSKMFLGDGDGEIGIEASVPNFTGQTVEAARTSISGDEFTIVEERQVYDESVAAGHIISQDPKPFTKVKTPKEVYVVVSLGNKTLKLSDYTKKEYREAEIQIGQEDLAVRVVEINDDLLPEGIVVRQDPAPGTEMKAGELVILYVSAGRAVRPVTVPSLSGRTEGEAKRIIEQTGLVYGKTSRRASDQDAGTVLEQSLPADSEVNEKTVIDLVVSDGPRPQSGKTLSIDLPQDREQATVKITIDGKTVHQQIYKTSDTPVKSQLFGTGRQVVRVYIDEVLVREETVDF